MIIDGYIQYINYGYPDDPRIYVIKAGKLTLAKIKSYIESTILNDGKKWQFQLKSDASFKEGYVTFGPEQLEFIME